MFCWVNQLISNSLVIFWYFFISYWKWLFKSKLLNKIHIFTSFWKYLQRKQVALNLMWSVSQQEWQILRVQHKCFIHKKIFLDLRFQAARMKEESSKLLKLKGEVPNNRLKVQSVLDRSRCCLKRKNKVYQLKINIIRILQHIFLAPFQFNSPSKLHKNKVKAF